MDNFQERTDSNVYYIIISRLKWEPIFCSVTLDSGFMCIYNIQSYRENVNSTKYFERIQNLILIGCS